MHLRRNAPSSSNVVEAAEMRESPSSPEDPKLEAKEDKAMSNLKVLMLITALCLAVFCQALDNTIIATAIPRITDEFNSLEDVGWYGSGYLLTTCAFQLSYGKLYNLYPIKGVFLVSLAIFEIGSLVCGATPNSVGLIMGRVVAGIGSGGIFSGAVLIIAEIVPLEKRPIYNGLLGAMYAIASVAGPLMGGAFTEYVTWRLCFYINLPFGVVTALAVVFFLRNMSRPEKADLSFKEKVKEFDVYGILVFIPTIVCLLLAIQWGGSKYPWNNARIIALFAVGGLLLCAFVGLQIWQGDRATVPPSVVKQRTIWACSIFCFFLFGSFLAITYYIPIWFQAIKNDSATESGIHNLPSILGVVVMSLVAGGLVFGSGYYTWACITSSVMASIGAGLLTTFTPRTGSAAWIGYQIIYGAGVGIGLQQPLIAVQAVLPDEQVAEGTAIIIFIQSFGGAIFIAVAQTVFNNKLLSNILAERIPVNPAQILSQGATQIANVVPEQFLPQLRSAYNKSITETFYVAVAAAALSFLGSALIPWVSIKKRKVEKEQAKAQTQGKDNAILLRDI